MTISFTEQFSEDTGVLEAPSQALTVSAPLRDAALAPLVAIESGLRALSERYRNVAFDLSSSKGLGEAKVARYDLRENGRYAVRRACERFKKEANDAKRAVDEEAERLVALVKPREDEIDALISEREAQLAAEKALRERLDAERVAKHRANLGIIRGYVSDAAGKTAAQIGAAIERITTMREAIDDEGFAWFWQEFAEEAAATWDNALSGLQALHLAAQTSEAEAQRLEAQRLENERAAALLAAERAVFAAEKAARDAEREANDDAARRAEQRRQAEADEHAERAAGALAEQQRFEAQPSAPAKPVITVDLDTTRVIDLPAPELPPTLRLGAIGTRLGFTVTSDFLASLGFAPAGRAKAAVLYHEHDFPRLCVAISSHVLRVGLVQP